MIFITFTVFVTLEDKSIKFIFDWNIKSPACYINIEFSKKTNTLVSINTFFEILKMNISQILLSNFSRKLFHSVNNFFNLQM